MVKFSSQNTQQYYTKVAALPSVLKWLTHKTISQSVIQNTSSFKAH